MSENVLLCFFISTLLIIPCKAADTYCSTGSNFTQGSKMDQNRNTVVNNLVRHAASSGGFNTTISGQSPNQIYGLLQCRGDVTTEKCSACSLDINSTIRQLCANAAAALIFVNDNCYLTYAPSNFIGQLDNSTELYRINGENATNPAAFSSAIKRLFSNLSAKVEESPTMFASGFTSEYSEITKIYGLIQCRRDMNGEDCRDCVGRGIRSLLNASENGFRSGGVGWFGSCLVIYQTYPFYASNYLVPPTMSPFSKILPSSSGEDWPFSQDGQTKFSLETLRAATRDFHEDNKLGEGGFGAVYKGIMPDGREIAVKKLSLQSPQGKQEFENEVKLLAKIQHQNLVNLLGCCTEGSESLLVTNT